MANPGPSSTHSGDAVTSVAIIGGGPAGMRLAQRLASASHVVVIDSFSPGGQLLSLGMVELAGEGPRSAGPDLATDMLEAVLDLGVELSSEEVTTVTPEPGGGWRIEGDDGSRRYDLAVVATGSGYGESGLPQAADWIGRGVSFCAGCDAPMYADAAVAVVGAGPWAASDAVGLSSYAARVHIVGKVPHEELIQDQPRVTLHAGSRPSSLLIKDGRLAGLSVTSEAGDFDLAVSGVFVSAAPQPRTDLVAAVAELDDAKRILVDEQFRAYKGGLFAIGDVRAGSPGTVASALSDADLLSQVLLQELRRTGHEVPVHAPMHKPGEETR